MLQKRDFTSKCFIATRVLQRKICIYLQNWVFQLTAYHCIHTSSTGFVCCFYSMQCSQQGLKRYICNILKKPWVKVCVSLFCRRQQILAYQTGTRIPNYGCVNIKRLKILPELTYYWPNVWISLMVNINFLREREW